jgi:hypothetical protein
MQTHFYDEQIRRFLLQLVRMFSNFQVEFGKNETGDNVFYRVPVKYGDGSRNAAVILQGNSANTLPATPQISLYISSLDYARDRVQNPTFVDKFSIRQKQWDEGQQEFLNTQGNAYTIERMMPAPYDLKVKVDLWTSNTDQKLQLLEQMLVLFNPSLEIQSTENYLDWTSLSVVTLDNVTFTSRSVPQGTDDSIDVATLDFSMPIWLSAPARVKKLGVIQKIITSVFDGTGQTGDLSSVVGNKDLLLGTRQAVTFQDYGIFVLDGQAKLLKNTVVSSASTVSIPTVTGDTRSWPAALEKYGVIRNGITQIRLQWQDDFEIVGTVALDPSNDQILLFTPDLDTLPANTLDPITAIINPQKVGPGFGLPEPAAGQRYLLLDNIGDADDNEHAEAWYVDGEPVADRNDIIAYDTVNRTWRKVFDSKTNPTVQYVTNLTTSMQYKLLDGKWVRSWEGKYDPLYWRVII